MTTYYHYVDPAFEATRQQLLSELNDIILTTADYLELYFRTFKKTPLVGSFTWKWMYHFIPKANWYSIPITTDVIINTAFFTVYIRLRFEFAPRGFFFYPINIPQSESPSVAQVEAAIGDMHLE